MSYAPTNWQNGITPVNADNLNKIEKELARVSQISDVSTDTIEHLENLKAPGIICTASGEPVVITDCSDMAFSDIEVDGASEQAQYSGKNSLKCTLGNKTHVGVTITDNGDGTYTLNGTATATVSDIYLATGYELKAGTYKVTGYPAGATGWIQLNHSGGAITSTTFTLSADAVCDVRLGLSNGVSYNNVILKPMITTDTTATYDDFEPYIGGPSPSPEYPQPIKSVGDSGSLEIKTVGKNHLKNNIVSKQFTKNGVTITINDDKSITLNGTCTAWGIQNLNYGDNGDELDGTYYLTGGSANAPLQAIVNTSGGAIDSGSGKKVTFDKSLGANKNWIRFTVNEGITYNETIYPLLRKCDENGNPIGDDTYEPYQSNSITIPLSEPLRQNDKIVKQDGVWGVERGTKRVVFNGLETWIKSGSAFYTEQEQDMALNVSGYASALCDKAIIQNWATVASGGFDNSFTIYKDTVWSKARIAIYVNGITSVADFKAYLAENPITVEYKIATPTFEPFDTDTQIAINSLHGYKTVTYVSTDSEVKPTLIVDYVADTKTYIDNKFNELAAALVAGSEV